MALGAGTHPWPDANHRTALLSFDLAIRHALGLSLRLDPTAAQRLVTASKAMRDPEYLRRGRYYTVKELAGPQHPYRTLMADYETDLVLEPAE